MLGIWFFLKGLRLAQNGNLSSQASKHRRPDALRVKQKLHSNLVTLTQQEQVKDEMKTLVQTMSGVVEQLKRNESSVRVETLLQELISRLVRCYAIAQWLLGNSLLQAQTAIAATFVSFVPRKLCICGMNEKFAIPSRHLRSFIFCREFGRNQASLSQTSS